MAFTPGFEHDIFISYTHLDNSAPGDEPGWVDRFHDELESWLARRFGHKKIAVWRDKKLRGGTLFDNRIQEVIRDSALFLALLSPNYLNSGYCRKELEWFYKEAETSRYGLSIKDESRIFNVLLRNIHYSTWPSELEGSSGFPMHDQKEGSAEPGESLDHRDLQYKKKLQSVVDAVEAALTSFPRAGGSDVDREAVETEGEAVRVFIADTADTLRTTRDRLAADLKAEGVTIVTDIPPPWDGPGHEAAVKKAVDGADLAVHLLDPWPGRGIDGSPSSTYPCAQVKTGLRSRTRQVVWVPKSLAYEDIEDREYAGFLESLERGTREKPDFEFIRDEKTCLSRLVRQTVDQIRLERETTARGNDAPILLDAHQKDQLFAFRLAAYLSGKGLWVEFNKESVDPVTSLRNFEAALKYVRNLIIVYGMVEPVWVLERVKKTINLVCAQKVETDNTTLENLWVCLVPSNRQTGEFEGLPKFFRIDYLDNRHSDIPDEDVFGPLLASAKAGGTE